MKCGAWYKSYVPPAALQPDEQGAAHERPVVVRQALHDEVRLGQRRLGDARLGVLRQQPGAPRLPTVLLPAVPRSLPLLAELLASESSTVDASSSATAPMVERPATSSPREDTRSEERLL